MADFSDIKTTDQFAGVLANFNDQIQALQKQLAGTQTNLVTGAIQWDASQSRWVKYNGASFDPLAIRYGIDVDKLQGKQTSTGATGDTIALRDATGRIKAAAPSASTEVTRKAELDAHKNDTTNPHSVTKSQAGVGNVDNTSDVDKPVSTATTEAIRALYPVGSIYMNATNATNPSTLLGFGTWAAFGAGRVPVGHDASDALFDVAEETGGSKDAVNVSHSHTGAADSAGGHSHSGSTNTTGSHSHGMPLWGLDVNTGNDEVVRQGGGDILNTDYAGNHSHSLSINAVGNHSHTVSVDTSGVSGTNANLQPYITVYMWKRTL